MKMDELMLMVREKDKEIKMQGYKLKEILSQESKMERNVMVKKNYDEINRLSSPNLANRNDLNVK